MDYLLFPALPIAAVLAWFGPFANHALKMRVEKSYREMWGAAALSLIPASFFWLVVVSGELPMLQRNLLLIPAGAIVGACIFAWAGYLIHDVRGGTSSKSSPATDSAPKSSNTMGDISNNSGIITQGQQGDNAR